VQARAVVGQPASHRRHDHEDGDVDHPHAMKRRVIGRVLLQSGVQFAPRLVVLLVVDELLTRGVTLRIQSRGGDGEQRE